MSPRFVAAVAASAAFVVSSPAHASNPLEYPDNGSASFSRGGAWLATANEPIATHYNPAALAIQGSGVSIEQNLAFDKVCYDRRGPDGQEETASDGLQYLPACNTRSGFPSAVPSMSIAFRVSDKLGIGLAVVPPSTYVIAENSFPSTKLGYNTVTKQYQQVPAPYRYQLLEQQSTILFPTVSVGYELLKNFRVGVGFISGIASINTTVGGVATENSDVTADHAYEDGFTQLKTKDLFMPGVVVGIHWSPASVIDVAAWGRYISPIDSTQGEFTLSKNAYASSADPAFSVPNPICRQGQACQSNSNVQVPYRFGNDTFRHFVFPIPPEVRLGLRYHQPRHGQAKAKAPALTVGTDAPKRDPLHEDVFDVEVDGSYTFNEAANTIEIRFDERNGQGTQPVFPGYVPPNADRWNGFKNSIGVRLGGQYNVIQDKFAVRAGTWLETQAQQPEWLQISYVAALRGGFGGGVVFRQDFIDISFGFQHQWSAGLDNHGHGLMRGTTTAGTNPDGTDPNINKEPPGVTAATRQQYRTYHTVNDGRITQSANVFTLGGTIHF
ncbi:MAG TPA: hypothetical protein VHE30_23335 [Polyangiaceae bacterium]|nr:hypothetical protein [Polyangiaceae bacterium]